MSRKQKDKMALGQLKLGYRPDEAAHLLGSEKLLADCVAEGWLRPVVQVNRCTLYDQRDLVTAWERVAREGWPGRAEGAR